GNPVHGLVDGLAVRHILVPRDGITRYCCLAFDAAVLVPADLSAGIGTLVRLIAHSAWPLRKSGDGLPGPGNFSFDGDYVTVSFGMKNLASRKIAVRVFEDYFVRMRSGPTHHIESFIQPFFKILVVRKERKRISQGWCGCFVDQIERLAFVILILLEDPRLHQPATVGENDSIEIVFKNTF